MKIRLFPPQGIAALLAFLLAACGWFDSNPAVPVDGDADAGEDCEGTMDDVPADEAPGETPDPPADQADGREDPGEDILGEEIATDVGDVVPDREEIVPDVVPDIGDVFEEEAVGPCNPLEGTISGVNSWTDSMTRTTIATFDLALSNDNSTSSMCVFSEITVAGGILKNASAGSLILTYDTVEPTDPLIDILRPSERAIVFVRAECSPCTASCDIDVIVELTVAYRIDGLAAPPIRIESAPATHVCVY
jgi:hypothetical protein